MAVPWYRSAMALIFGVGVMLIAAWSIYQGEGALLISSVAAMAFTSVLLIFGVEVNQIKVSFGEGEIVLDFTNSDD